MARRRAPGQPDVCHFATDRRLRRLAVIAWVCSSACPQLEKDDFSGHRLSETDAGDGLPDLTRPRVLSSTPANGAVGVSTDAVIEVTFSEPMDRAATEAAYASLSIRRDRSKLSWRNEGRVLVIDPTDPLPHASGTDLKVPALGYGFQLSTQARDVAGNPLFSPLEVTFTVNREITQGLELVKDRNFTGNFRTDDNYGILGCERIDTTICVGDSAVNGVESTYRGFLTFDLGALPPSRRSISAATLNLPLAFVVGAPSPGLGTLALQQLAFETIDLAALDAPARATIGMLPSDRVAGDILSANVLSSVQASLDAGSTIQYRLAFSTGINGNLASDLVGFDWSAPRLDVTYWMP